MSHHPFPWREPFLAALREWPIVQHACDVVGIQRSTAYRARLADEDLAKAWDEAMEAGIDRAEHEAFRRAVQGVEEPVVYKGELTPVWEYNEDGEILRRAVKRVVAGEEVTEMVPVQARNPDGTLRWLTIRKPSDALLSLVLKGRRKAYSTERQEHVSPDGSMSPTDAGTREARAAQLLEAARRRRDAENDFGDLA